MNGTKISNQCPLDQIPKELRDSPAWVVWKNKSAPRSPVTDRQRDWNKDLGTWDDVERYLEDHPDYKPGFCFEGADGFFGLDLDACRDPETGAVESWAAKIVDQVGSYSEVSQSGTGIKIIGRCDPSIELQARTYFVQDARVFGDHVPQVEIFKDSKYFALTGEAVLDCFREVDLEALIDNLEKDPKFLGSSKTTTTSNVSTALAPRTYQEVFNAENSIESLLLGAGWSMTRGGLKRPGKTDDGISATIKVDDLGVERLTVWSTSVPEFEASEPGGRASTYDAWSVWARVEFNGDLGQAKKAFLHDRPELEERSTPEEDFGAPSQNGFVDPGAQLPKGPKGLSPEIRALLLEEPIEDPLSDILDDLDDLDELDPVIVDGLIREGEICNLIAPSKLGKSFLIGDLAYSVSLGGKWLGRFDIPRARPVLVLDNELKPNTLRKRYRDMARVRDLCVELGEVPPRLGLKSLRGRIPDLYQLGMYFDRIEPGRYGLIILDAFYRFLPKGVNENDNADMTGLYNILDGYASKLETAFLIVHHTSKGDQSQKSKVDVGAGAGAMARAADAHIVIRPHEEEGLHVLEGEARSFPPPPSMSIEFVDLRWRQVDIAAVVRNPGRKKDKAADSAAKDRIVKAIRDAGSLSQTAICEKGADPGNKAMGIQRAKGLIQELVSEGRILEETQGDKKQFVLADKGLEVGDFIQAPTN